MHVWLISCMVSPRVGLHWCMGSFCTQTESRVFCSIGRAGPHLFGWLGLLFIVCSMFCIRGATALLVAAMQPVATRWVVIVFVAMKL